MIHKNAYNSCINKLKQAIPTDSWSSDFDVIAPHLIEWRDRWEGQTPLLLLPKSTEEVGHAVKICAEHGVPITPQGGNTGLVGGQIPQGEILLSTKRMDSVLATDNYSITVQAGCILQNVQKVADDNNLLFPLSLASQGSATIGGLCSSNAGGVNVVRYGSMRNLTLGLEVVLADGSILNTLAALKKDNTGYNLTPLFLGAEGTLGIITAAKLQLFSKPTSKETLFIAVEHVSQAVLLYHLCKLELPNNLSLIELIPHTALEFVSTHIPNTRLPFSKKFPWYVLLEFEFSDQNNNNARVEKVIVKAFAEKIIFDAIHAESVAQAKLLTDLREYISQAQKPEGGSIKHDISVPINSIPKFIQQATIAVKVLIPGCRPVPFGHLGDGNIHFNVSQPVDMDKAEFLSYWESVSSLIHDIVMEFGGSISAEHGIGILKKKELSERADITKLYAMKQIKHALDPKNIMNPRVLFE